MLCPYCRTENRPGAVKCAACASWMVESPPVREWYRSRDNRMVAGVCRGMARRFGMPIAALRLAFLLALFLGGWGIVVYVALWIAMPLDPVVALLPAGTPPPPPQQTIPPPHAA